jgi:CarD family transcriptional regulator
VRRAPGRTDPLTRPPRRRHEAHAFRTERSGQPIAHLLCNPPLVAHKSRKATRRLCVDPGNRSACAGLRVSVGSIVGLGTGGERPTDEDAERTQERKVGSWRRLLWRGVRLAVGDVVVYAPHGVGRVATREKRLVLGATQEILVLELADSLSVTLPVERARELLRPLLSEVDLRRVQETPREDHKLSEDVWLKRRKDTQVKLADGDPLGLAEVVRDCARRQQRLMGKRTGSQLSPSERDLYLRARRLLSGEIGLARGLDPADADAWIEEQLAATA